MSNVEKPNHYQLKGLEPYESIDVIRAVLGDKVKYFYIGNILKYIIRAEKKNGLEDYKKALEDELNRQVDKVYIYSTWLGKEIKI